MNNPYYNAYPIEVIKMMEKVFGTLAVKHFALLNAFKYRMRAGIKSENIQEDLAKEKDYLSLAKGLRANITSKEYMGYDVLFMGSIPVAQFSHGFLYPLHEDKAFNTERWNIDQAVEFIEQQIQML